MTKRRPAARSGPTPTFMILAVIMIVLFVAALIVVVVVATQNDAAQVAPVTETIVPALTPAT